MKVSFPRVLVGLGMLSLLSPLVLAHRMPDVPVSHVYHDAVDYVFEHGIVKGYPDGTYQPSKTINRAELIKILVEAKFPGTAAGSKCFSDVQEEWFAPYVCTAKDKKIISGYPDGSFQPAKDVSFVEAAKMISLTFDLPQGADVVWYKPYVDTLAEHHAIPLAITAFDKSLTRGEMAEMIYRLHAGKVHLASQTYNSIFQKDISLALPETEEVVTEETPAPVVEVTPPEEGSTSTVHNGELEASVELSEPLEGAHMEERNGITYMEMSTRIAVLEDGDDASENLTNGEVTLSSQKLSVSNGSALVGLRFQGVDIPRGAIIKTAFIEFRTGGKDLSEAVFKFRGEATDNALAFVKEALNLSSRSKTTAEAISDPAPLFPGDGNLKFSANLAPVLQEIFDRPGWKREQSFAVLMEGTGERLFYSIEGGASVKMNLRYLVPVSSN